MPGIQDLLDSVKEDKALRDKLLASKSVEEAVAVANSEGFSFSTSDWLAHQASQTLELTDEDLEGIAGGGNNSLSACGKYESC